METIKDIVADIRRRNDDGFPLDGESSHPLVEDMRLLADRIDEAYKSYNREVVELLKDIIAGICVHCDMQSACQERGRMACLPTVTP